MKKTSHDYTDFGKQAKLMMVDLNLSNKALAEKLGYKPSTLCDVLKGRNRNVKRMQEIQDTLTTMVDGL